MNLSEWPAFGTLFRHTNVPYYDWRLVVYVVPILSQFDPIHTPTSHFLKIHLNIILPSSPGSPKWSRSIRFPHQTPVYPSPPYVLHAPHLNLLGFITRTILGEEYRSFSSSLCVFLHSPVTSSLLGPNILLSTIFSNTLSLRSSLYVSDQVSHSYKTDRQNYSSVYLNIYIFG